MASGLGEPQLDYDFPMPPAPLQGYVNFEVPADGGGEAPQDPQNGTGTVPVPPQPSPAGGGGGGTPSESVGQISCYEFHYIDLICNGSRIPAFFGGYWYGGSIGQFDCPDSGNAGTPGGKGPGVPGVANCSSTYSGPNGASCVPNCSGSDGAAGNGTPPGPIQPPVPPPPAGGGGSGPGSPSPNNSPGGSSPPNDEPSSGSGTGGGGAGGTISGGIFVGGGGGGAGGGRGIGDGTGREPTGPGIMDYPPNTGSGKRQFTVQLTDGQLATAVLDTGESIRLITNADGSIIVAKISKDANGKTIQIEIARLRPREPAGLDTSGGGGLQTGISGGGITTGISGGGITTGITHIEDKPLGTGELDEDPPRYYPTPQPPLIGIVHFPEDDEPLPPRNDPRPRPKPKKRKEEDDSPSPPPPPPPPPPGGGVNANATQVVIVQDDCSQSFVRIT